MPKDLLVGAPIKRSEAVQKFATFSIAHRFHKRGRRYLRGGGAGGWSTFTLNAWQKAYIALKQDYAKEEINAVLDWFITNYDDPSKFVPTAHTFSMFAERFETIKRAKQRAVQQAQPRKPAWQLQEEAEERKLAEFTRKREADWAAAREEYRQRMARKQRASKQHE